MVRTPDRMLQRELTPLSHTALLQIALIHAAYTAIVYFVLGTLDLEAGNYTSTRQSLCIVFIASAVWLTISCYMVCREIYHPYFLFLLSALLFNGGQIILTGMGIEAVGLVFNQFSSATVLQTIILILESLIMLHMGVLLFLSGHSESDQPLYDEKLTLSAARNTGYALIITTAIPYLALIVRQLSASAEGYAGLYTIDDSPLLSLESVASNLFLSGILFSLAGTRPGQKPQRWLLALSAFDISASLFVGTRARAMMFACALLFVWTRRIGRIPKALTAGIVGCALITVPAVSVMRDLPIADRLSPAAVMNNLPENTNPAIAVLSEMGLSFLTTAYTIDLVPKERPYEWGMSYVRAILFTTPGLGRLLKTDDKPIVLALWLIAQIDPINAMNNGGYGFSFIAEAYLNFGSIGGPIACLALGLLVAYLSFRKNDALSVAFVGCSLLVMPFFSRGESISAFRSIVYQCIVPSAAAVYVIRQAKANRSRAVADRGRGTAHTSGHVAADNV